MATYTEAPFHNGPWGRAYTDVLAWRCAAREYANGDIIKLFVLGLGTKVGDCVVANNEADEDASPTLTGVLELAHATESAIPIVSVAAATLGVDDGFTRTNNIEGLGITTQEQGYWVQFRFTAANANPKSAILAFTVPVTNLLYRGEDPTAPTG